MSVLTEEELRKRLKNEDLDKLKEFHIKKGEIITPAAISFLNEHNIILKYGVGIGEIIGNVNNVVEEVIEKPKYETIFGIPLNEKPEYMTHLRGDLLVFKDHRRIILRGKLDSLESKILEVQILCHKEKLNKLVEDLEEIIMFIRGIVRCEVAEEPVKKFFLLGMNSEELRDRSHHTTKYYGIGFTPPNYKMGEIVISLNTLRTLTRETELSAFKAFKDEYGKVEREDIIRALNRLSSVFWIMMFKFRAGQYNK